MQEQNEFFEKGLEEILCSGSPSGSAGNEQTNQLNRIQIPTDKQKKHVQFSDIIVRLLAAFVAVALLISFSANISLK